MTSSRPTDKEPSGTTTVAPALKPWPALWALVIGFFMILVDTTIVSVANPSIMEGLNTGINEVIWVTSAYLLAYAVPLLITGRLGDRFGPKNIYLIGLVVFTLSSAWCGLSGDITTLIVARVFQGLGAAMMTPQTMAVITRIFPPDRRGQAMGLWGATAGVATLVGPILGGVLVDSLGWEWIFFVNVPVGVVAFIMAWRLVPALATHKHRFDLLGVALSAIGMFLVVFGIQEGESYDWGEIVGPISVWSLIITGIVFLVGFVLWQHYNRGEPLLPLQLFRDRNFSLSNGAITTVGFAITGMTLPLMFYFQLVLGLPPTQSALMLAPSAVLSGVLAPFVGRLVDIINPRYVAVTGLLLLAGGLYWYFAIMTADAPIWLLLLPSAVLGLANAAVWSPISSTATRHLPAHQAGAGSGVYNTTRQVGAVLGSAAIAALIQSRLMAEVPAPIPAGALPVSMHDGYAAAMGQSLLLPAAAAVLGAIIVMFWAKPKAVSGWGAELTTSASLGAADPVEAPIETALAPVPNTVASNPMVSNPVVSGSPASNPSAPPA
ncbi:DHA2 family efflux MFS transporter permease subunit [Homoserinimonas sp. OAct 916]|uniref:DHA2 family efflux MFS transporter permease subunit n=1 Tax=Homoserinimonas sp. OAct 916 TaxID=2211450 RepID=UPI000DBE9158|nr:DHA2 family efflux MFS transporter permease subunit [Homoserinimonas sp. OAct 916]